MYTVKLARETDLPTILEIAQKFWEESPSYQQRPINIQKVERHLKGLIMNPHGCLFICLDDQDNIVGGFAGAIVEEWQADSFMAFDYCLFVKPEHRGSKAAYLLINAFLYWAKTNGATWVQCGTATLIDTEKTINFYKRMGFEHTGSFLERKI